MELIVPTLVTSQDFFRISLCIMHKKTLQIVYYTQEGIVLKFMVLYLGSGQAADLIFFFFKLEKVNESSSGEVGKDSLRVHHHGYSSFHCFHNGRKSQFQK